MARWIASVIALPAAVAIAAAQVPQQRLPFRPLEGRSEPAATPPGFANGLLRESLTEFDTSSVTVKGESGQWQLWAGGRMLKDFGKSEADARMALLQFRTLRLNSRGSVGGDFEYYLCDGAAPTSPLRNKLVVPFDSASLRAEYANGQWVLRDGQNTLYGFGESESDARLALAICRKYGFNQIAVIGQPVPALKYLLRDPSPPMILASRPPVAQASAQAPVVEAPARPLFIRGVGAIGNLSPLDYRQLRLRRDPSGWTLMQGNAPLASFGRNDQDANSTLQLLREFRCTELCKFGQSEFGFLLSNGKGPSGSFVGVQSRTLDRERLQVKSVGGVWSIFENSRPLFSFGNDETAARNALTAIRHFQFDTYAAIGGGHLGQTFLMAKTR